MGSGLWASKIRPTPKQCRLGPYPDVRHAVVVPYMEDEVVVVVVECTRAARIRARSPPAPEPPKDPPRLFLSHLRVKFRPSDPLSRASLALGHLPANAFRKEAVPFPLRCLAGLSVHRLHGAACDRRLEPALQVDMHASAILRVEPDSEKLEPHGLLTSNHIETKRSLSPVQLATPLFHAQASLVCFR
ncbi:hypothetical protein CC80DRAFT_509701 [Byssothecium circinans]|uniref:Uncharacterized protein n=1 Tax=Byssothecium circinans TaxID=147558 RepID=A0A6A5TCL9_9PLEO|nr:hypothetical protein CC80DRAFT_509701 [Byssothecium circinans]